MCSFLLFVLLTLVFLRWHSLEDRVNEGWFSNNCYTRGNKKKIICNISVNLMRLHVAVLYNSFINISAYSFFFFLILTLKLCGVTAAGGNNKDISIMNFFLFFFFLFLFFFFNKRPFSSLVREHVGGVINAHRSN